MLRFFDRLASIFAKREYNFTQKSDDYAYARDSSREDSTIDRFSNYLPYVAWDPEYNLIVLESDKPGKIEGMGFCFELNPQTGASREMADFLTNLFTVGAPVGTGIQISMYASPVLDSFFNRYLDATISPNDQMSPSQFKQAKLIRALAERRVAYYRKATKKPIFQDMNYLMRDYRLMMSVIVPADDANNHKKKREIITLREGCIATLKAYHLYDRDWNAEDLINWCSMILNPHMTVMGDHPHLEYDDTKEIRHQIISKDTKIEEDEDHIVFSGAGYDPVAVRAMSVRQYPRQFQLPQMGSLIGHDRSYTIAYNCPFMITFGCHIVDFDTEKNKSLVKGARATQTLESPIAKFMPGAAEVKQDYDITNLAFDDGKGVVKLYHQLLLFTHPDDVFEAEQAAKSVWRSEGIDIATDRKCQKQALLGSLPLLFGPLLQKDMKIFMRAGTKTVYNAANSLPVISEWRGIGNTPVLSMFGRRGQVMGVDIFANPAGNYNGIVVGASGSGKSNFMVELAWRTVATGGRVWIIDVGRSYEKVCNILGGQYIEFTPDSDICLNPFDLVKTLDEDMDILKPLIAQMIQPNSPLNDYELAQIDINIRELWDEFGPRMTVEQLADRLKKSCYDGGSVEAYGNSDTPVNNDTCDPQIRELGVQLFPFTEAGSYGRFFNGRANINFNSNFVVLELEELKGRKDLQSVIMLLLMYRITNEMYLNRTGQKSLVIIDEAWDLMGSGNAGQFIEAGYRRARKYGGAFFTGTQSIGDYYKSDTAKAAFENADWMFLLRQKAESIEELKKSGKMVMDEYTKSMLNSVTTASGRYSEVFMRCADMPPTIGRLFFDPFSMMMASTKAEDFKAIKDLTESGLSTEDAIEALLKRKGIKL
jgi:conjugal transfer ATP-binding protein TraC